MPDNFWISTFANFFLFVLAYALSRLLGAPQKNDLTGLTLWK